MNSETKNPISAPSIFCKVNGDSPPRNESTPQSVDATAALILESITDAFLALDHAWRFTYLNAQAERLLSRTRTDLLGKNVWKEFPLATSRAFSREYHRAVQQKTAVTFEEYYPPPLAMWLEVRAFPSPEGLSVYLRDVTARRKAQEALRASEERYRAGIAHAAVGVTLADLQDCCLETNAAFCAITGYSEEELLSMDFPSLTHPDDREDSLGRMAQLRAGEISSFVMEKRYLRKDGGIVWVQNSVALVRDAEGHPASTIALTEDISTRKRAEAEREDVIARQRAFLRDVLASVTDGRLVLCQEESELPVPQSEAMASITLTRTEGLSEMRQAARVAARATGHPEERIGELVMAVSEAGMNTIVHAGTGTGEVFVSPDGTVQVRIIDHGGGITLENLPNATLKRGFTTAGTLGQGMKMMLETVDRVFLRTGEGGTTVVLEQERVPPLPQA